MKGILIGNSFPTTLIRWECIITPVSIKWLRARVKHALDRGQKIRSFWGHSNTVTVASDILGVDLTPETERPALSLTPQGLISFEGEEYHTVYILSPVYRPGFRPAIGTEVGLGDIKGWTALRVSFPRKIEHRRLV